MKRFYGLMIGLLLLSSCGSITASDTEKNALKAVEKVYGGTASWRKGFNTNNGETLTHFEISLSNSDVVKERRGIASMPASNIAYIFYSNITDEDRSNYDFFKIKLIIDTDTAKFEFDKNEVAQVGDYVPFMEAVNQKIMNKDYTSLFNDFLTDNPALTVESLASYLTGVDNEYGEVKEMMFEGYEFTQTTDGNYDLIHLSAKQHREKEDTAFSLFIDTKTKKIHTLKFDYN